MAAGRFRKRGCKCPDKKKCKCNATWSFTVDVGRDPITNKRVTDGDSGFKTKKEATDACAAMVTDYARGNLQITASKGKDTVESFMTNFLDTVLINDVEGNTLENKIVQMDKYIIPALGKIELKKLTPMAVQKFINDLIAKELSAGTIQNIMRLFNQTMNKALEWGYVTRNVIPLTSKPSYKPEKFEIWNNQQFQHFLSQTKESRLYPYYLIALTTGMRPGEIAALSWDKIDTKKNIIRVEWNAVYSKAKGLHIKPTPKNDSSKRNITVPESVISYLKRLKLSQVPNELNLVVPGIKNPIIYNSVINKIFKADVAAAGLPQLKPHGLRHTHATYLLSPSPFGLGQALKAVSERLGHANANTTLSTYSHVLPNMQESLAEQLEKSLNF
jgi:integrase